MKQNWLAAFVILGNLVLLSLPLIGLVILWVHFGRNEPLMACYLVVLSPVAWLIWAVCKQRQWHETDSTILRGFSVFNTMLLFTDVIGFLVYMCRTCAHTPLVPGAGS